jgi:hypothetical protein
MQEPTTGQKPAERSDVVLKKKNSSRETNSICSDNQFRINLIAKKKFKGRQSVFL